MSLTGWDPSRWGEGARGGQVISATLCIGVGLTGCARLGFERLDPEQADGGASTGGASTGGASTGGAATGGSSTGGSSTGGAATGGASTGGAGGAGGALPDGGPSPEVDGGPPDPDLDPPALACSTFGAFGTPQELAGLGAFAFRPTLSADGLTLIYARGDAADLFIATRSSTGGTFTSGAPLPGPINTASAELTPFLSRDGLSLYFASDRAGGLGQRDIMVAPRSSRQDDFGAPAFVPAVNGPGSEILPTLGADGLTLYFRSDRGGGQGLDDIWRVSRAAITDPFASPVNVSELNSPQADSGVALRADGLEIIFASERFPSFGNDDLWVAERSAPDEPFSNLRQLPFGINSSFEDTDPALSADGTELFFSSTRLDPEVTTLWHVRRGCD